MALFHTDTDRGDSGNHRNVAPSPETPKRSLLNFAEEVEENLSSNTSINVKGAFRAIMRAVPSTDNVLEVRNLHPKRATKNVVLLVTVQTKRGPQSFVCKIPGPYEIDRMEETLEFRKNLTSPMIPRLYKIIHARGVCVSNGSLPVPIVIEEYVPHNITVDSDTEGPVKNPALYVDSLVFNSLYLFKEAAKKGAALSDNVARNIAVLDKEEPQFIYYDMGQIEPFEQKKEHRRNIEESFRKMMEFFIEIVIAIKKKIPEKPENAVLITEIDQWIKDTEKNIHNEKAKTQIRSKEDVIERIRSFIQRYREIRGVAGGPTPHIAYTEPRIVDTSFMCATIGERLRKLVGL